jgi:hypothetical protein
VDRHSGRPDRRNNRPTDDKTNQRSETALAVARPASPIEAHGPARTRRARACAEADRQKQAEIGHDVGGDRKFVLIKCFMRIYLVQLRIAGADIELLIRISHDAGRISRPRQ